MGDSLLTASQPPQADQIRDLFNRIAPRYDQMNQEMSWGLHRVWKQMAVDWCAASAGMTCLDLCCGSGDVAFLLARKVGPNGKVVGADFAAHQLEVAAQRYPQLQARIDWVEADALKLPFVDETFEAATLAYGLRNLTDFPKGLNELRRVLKPGARAAILDFHQPSSAIVQRFQTWYLNQVVVPTAERLGLSEEYAYISPSLERFPSGPTQVDLALAAGFATAVHYPMAGGMMGTLVATNR